MSEDIIRGYWMS